MNEFDAYIKDHFGADQKLLLEAITSSPSSRGYIMGAISEVLLKSYLEGKGFEVVRIVEKPSGGNNAKSAEARGDFYIREKGSKEDAWLVLESKGLKSNSEFRGSKLDNKIKVFRFLKNLAFHKDDYLQLAYDNGLARYGMAKTRWEHNNPGKSFPPFRWRKEYPGAMSCNLGGLWKDEDELKAWVEKQPVESFEEKAYRKVEGPIAILETHQPSKRVDLTTGIDQAAPLVQDFNIMTVDLFLRTGKHEFVFMNAEEIAHSPSSPNHLYQNYTIDILVKGLKGKVVANRPWYKDILDCISSTKPILRKLDSTQIDHRNDDLTAV